MLATESGRQSENFMMQKLSVIGPTAPSTRQIGILAEVKKKPMEIAKQKAPAVGRGIGGVGNLVQGVGLIIYGDHLRKAGEVALGNVNIAQGAFWIAVGSGDAIDGTIKFLSGSLGKVKIPSIWGMTTLGRLAPLLSTSMDVLGALGGIAFTIAGVALQLKAEKDAVVTETHTMDAVLKKYGINGGPTMPHDITVAGPLGDSAQPPGGIGGTAGASGPRYV